MTPDGMAALRIAATLVHALPGVRIRLRHGGRTLLEVCHPAGADGPSIGPCQFRGAVTRAHEQLKAGARLAFLDLPEGVGPAVDIGLRPGDRALPGGIYQVRRGVETVTGFATTLPPRQCRAVLDRDRIRSAGDPVRLHHDAATEITFVHLVTRDGRPTTAQERRLHEVLAACMVDEVVRDLTGAAH